MKKKATLTMAMFSLLLLSTLTSIMQFDTAKATTNFSGIIGSNTVWTKANSPYNLTGPVAVTEGTTLTIEAGTTLNLNTYYLRVNGTLVAKGTTPNPIYINYGSHTLPSFENTLTSPNYGITLTASAASWNEQTGTGCIIENAVFTSAFLAVSVNAKISHNVVKGGSILVINGAPLISENELDSIGVQGGAPKILSNNINYGTSISGGSPVISNNIIKGFAPENGSTSPTSTGISIKGNNNASITENTISGSFDQTAIYVESGAPTIQRNLITNNRTGGVAIEISSYATPTIQNNTIADSATGISTSSGNLQLTLTYNNFENIGNYRLYWNAATNLNAAYNWWGTTDVQTINQSIYDRKNDFNLGEVSFVPFLSSPNPQATPDPNAPIPTPFPSSTPVQSPSLSQTPAESSSPTQNPTASPDQSSNKGVFWGLFYGVLAVLVVVVAALSVAVAVLLRRTRRAAGS